MALAKLLASALPWLEGHEATAASVLVILLILAGMGFSHYVSLGVALLALAGYLLLSIHAYLSARVLGELKLSYLFGGPTELRFILIGLTLAMIWLGPKPGLFAPISGFDIFVGTAAVILNLLFIKQTLVTARRLDLMERGGGEIDSKTSVT